MKTAGVAAVMMLAAAGCVPVARAADPGARHHVVLVELYTSQGCSSCPAADAFVRALPRLGFDRARVVPLTFHVDYWDDLGWKDPFAAPSYTDRQRRYVELGQLRGPDGQPGLHGLYTPQMIVDGQVHFSGAARETALRAIEKAAAQPETVDLDATAVVQGDRAEVSVRLTPRAADAFKEPLRLFVALASASARTRVTRGENSGETLEEAAVVRVLSSPARLTAPPTAPVTVSVSKPGELPWSSLELTAVLASDTTWRVLAARPILLPKS